MTEQRARSADGFAASADLRRRLADLLDPPYLPEPDEAGLRDKQRWPEGNWRTWLTLAGRRWGKTRSASYWTTRRALEAPIRFAVVAPVYAQARDVCVEGDTGLLHWIPRPELETWNRSLGELRLRNGSLGKVFGAEEPDRIRGHGFHGAWCDELASFFRPDAWDQLQIALSLGEQPWCLVSTTPKPVALVKTLVARGDGSVHVTRGTTWENEANLSAEVRRELADRYAGTRLGRQELDAEILEDVEGALWSQALLERNRVWDHPPLRRLALVVDPATGGGKGDETGIVLGGDATVGGKDHAYVLRDASLRAGPEAVAQRIALVWDEEGPGRLLVEDAFGQVAHVELALRAIGRTDIPVTPIPSRVGRHATARGSASGAKVRRLEPVVALDEQGRIHHVGEFPELEAQLTSWVPDESDYSPDRTEARGYLVSWLLLSRPQRAASASDVASLTMPSRV